MWQCIWQRAAQFLLCLEAHSDLQRQNKRESFVLEKLNIKLSNIRSATLRKRDLGVVSGHRGVELGSHRVGVRGGMSEEEPPNNV